MPVPHDLVPFGRGSTDGVRTDRVWYASFGSNMHRFRLDFYLAGGRPPGGSRTYPGCRNACPPVRSVPVMLPGSLYFAHESEVWTGGMAFHDPDGPGETAAHAHLLTAEQFADIAAQEMHRPPGGTLDLGPVLSTGRAETGPGQYETLLCPGLLDGFPVLTFTAPWRMDGVPHTRPSATYLRHLASGLAESHGWDADRIGTYLAGRPGAAGRWSAAQVAALMNGSGEYGASRAS